MPRSYRAGAVTSQEVFLLEKLKPPPEGSRAESERLPLLKAVVWVRPTVENISLLKAELGDPQFSEYHIAFTNRVRRELPEALEDFEPVDDDDASAAQEEEQDLTPLHPEIPAVDFV